MEKAGSQSAVIMGDSGRREGQAGVAIRARAFVAAARTLAFTLNEVGAMNEILSRGGT